MGTSLSYLLFVSPTVHSVSSCRQIEEYTHQIASIKAQIKMVCVTRTSAYAFAFLLNQLNMLVHRLQLKFGNLREYKRGQYTMLGVFFFLARES